MKIDKKNPTHWLQLIRFSLTTLLALFRRSLPNTKTAPPIPQILLYGHKFNGNLKALYLELIKHPDEFRVFFLSMDSAYIDQLQKQGIKAIDGCHPHNSKILATASAIVSDHGLHCLELLLRFSDIKFIDVWHGIPFKGFDKKDFRIQHRYEEIWVSSKLIKSLYVDKFGFPEHKVVITGYGRTDKLVHNHQNIGSLKRSLKITDTDKPVILFAPTWKQDLEGRNIYPFNMDETNFLELAQSICDNCNAYFVIRHHLNTTKKSEDKSSIIYLPADQYTDTEDILLISDLLICDWSSIAFDYLALSRPTLFLDVAPPFTKGFSLTPEFRYGQIVTNRRELARDSELTLSRPEEYWSAHMPTHRRTIEAVYDHTLDGKSASRYLDRIRSELQQV
ncbi:CDP-glycerol glycerophosphotransferase family protein [Pseudomaricurvus sp. HS19]|uniref:CDP-glycerol glycerophosphotransferase family protein n=1 Tax=Pseudomaricurvus sp. HS19 TaxID=2692626 RepID=UPI001369F91D|nr:CDP-glycerol glycerophosphotransferase family protein [Pseudomaricurvus sp. HS19]MYM64713.1 CDP-glycerol--glycerophosphate glycerophosphotransferase [Pseudomaricurvus sp. HS19]